MLVKTPVIKFGVEVRDTKVEDGRLVLSGVANAMPCSVEVGGRELLTLARRLIRPSVIGLMLRALFTKE